MDNQEYTLESLQTLLKNHIETTQVEKRNFEGTIEVLKNKIDKLQCELDNSNDTIERKEKQLRALQEELDQKVKQYDATCNELETVKTKLTCNEKDLDNLKNIVDNLNTNVQQKLPNEKLLKHLEDVIKQNDNLIKAKNDTITSNEEFIQILKKQIDYLKSNKQEIIPTVKEEEKDDDLIKKLKEENQCLRKHIEEAATKGNYTQFEKSLAEIQNHLNALKNVLLHMKESKELESTQLQDEIKTSMETLHKTYLEMENVLAIRNKNLEDIIDNLKNSLNQSSANISEIQKELLNAQTAQPQYNTDNLCKSDSTNSVKYVVSQNDISEAKSIQKLENTKPFEDPEELNVYYIRAKQEYTPESGVKTPVVKGTVSRVQLSELLRQKASDNTANITTKPISTDEREKIARLTYENELLRSEINSCKCQKSVALIPKQYKPKKTIPGLADLNNQFLLDNIHSILNSLNNLENSILSVHQNMNNFCKCEGLTNEGKTVFENIEQNMSELNHTISGVEKDFNEIENASLPIFKTYQKNPNNFTTETSSSVIQLQSSLTLIKELLNEIQSRRNCLNKDLELVREECEQLMKLLPDKNEQQSESDIKVNQTKNIVKYLPPNVKIYYPRDRKDSNTFLMYVPDDTCNSNSTNIAVTPTPSSLNRMKLIQLSLEAIVAGQASPRSNRDRKNVGDGPPMGLVTEVELDQISLNGIAREPIKETMLLQIWSSKYPLVECNGCGRKRPRNDSSSHDLSTSTSEIKLHDAQTGTKKYPYTRKR